MSFNKIEYKKFTYLVLDGILQLTYPVQLLLRGKII